MQLKIKYSDLIAKLTTDEYTQLEQNLIKQGCLDAIKVNKTGVILDGHNRYKICTDNKLQYKTEVIDISEADEPNWIYHNQLGRRNLTDEQKKHYIGKLYNSQKQTKGGDKVRKPQNEDYETTSKQLAKEQKVSHATVERAGKYVDQVESISSLDSSFEHLLLNQTIHATQNEITNLANHVKTDKVGAKKILDKVIKDKKSITAARREVMNDSLETKTLKPTNKKYQVIYADPPWEYNATLPPNYGDVKFHYKTMSIDDICNMPVKDITDTDCVLFLWVTSPMLPEGLKVIRAWGFEYKTSFIWDKVKHNVGHYNSVRHEFLLVAGKGKSTPTMDKKVLHDSVISIERSEVHSQKPEEFRKIIEELYPNTQKIELFARQTVKGWTAFGNEI